MAGLFLVLYATAYTLSAAVRFQNWEVDYEWRHWIGVVLWVAIFFIVNQRVKRTLPQADPILLPVAALLTGWGILTIYRLFPAFGLRQTLWLAVVMAIFFLGLRLPDHLSFLRRYKYLWLTGGLLLTALTLLFGTNPAIAWGPRLWLGCCGVYFQPSEPLKLLLIAYLAAYLADRIPLADKLLPLLTPTIIMTGLTLLLLLAQRDLGTGIIFIFIYAAVVYITTGRKRIILASSTIIALLGVAGYLLFDIVRLRIDSWINPWMDPSGRSYQIVQSLIAVASGGLLGRGPGMGYPALVPIPHSDFIFTAISEESGLLGAMALVILLAILTSRGLRIALISPDGFRRYLAAGLVAYLVGQSVLIIGGNLRFLPLTGVPLPFVAYGGSSLLTAFLSLLILMHISHHAETRPSLVNDPRPYYHLCGFLFAGLVAVAVVASWWAIWRGPELLVRIENPRRAIADLYVKRGSILDRNNNPLAITSGSPGEFSRRILYPGLASVVGYTHPVYGQSGIEAGLDPYLRGQEGNPEGLVWWYNLLYGYPPPGLDIRLSLDLEIQQAAHRLLADRSSALVLLNAENGEILAMVSNPTFDPNQLDETWGDLIKDPAAPLLNRAAQGRYSPGNALGPLLLAAAHEMEDLPPVPESLSLNWEGMKLDCAIDPAEYTWPGVIAAGCPAPQAALGAASGEDRVLALFNILGLTSDVPIHLTTAISPDSQPLADPLAASVGLDDLRVSPLQMARAIATLSNDKGNRPAPHLAIAVNIPDAGWSLIPALGEAVQVFPPETSAAVTRALRVERQPFWQSVARAPNGPGRYITWYLGGTQTSWGGVPLSLVLVLEEDNPSLAIVIGQAILQSAIRP